MEKENKSLSSKRKTMMDDDWKEIDFYYYREKHVKEFIKDLKDEFPLFEGKIDPLTIHNKLDEHGGKDLI